MSLDTQEQSEMDVMDDQAYQIESELYEEEDYTSPCKPTFNPSYTVSRFEFKLPQSVTVDSDGDLVVPRRKYNYVDIENKRGTALDLVGLQVWRGALLLADWVIYNNENIPKGSYILELGSGVGFSSIIGSMFTSVICTDINKGDILPLIRSNVENNKHITRHPVTVLELDFTSNELPEEIVTVLPNIPIIMAADVVYDDHITDAFVSTVSKLLQASPPGTCAVYVALEKRFVFTIEDCDSVAPCYEYFLRCLRKTKDINSEEVPLDFPKYFRYNRAKELVMWKLTLT